MPFFRRSHAPLLLAALAGLAASPALAEDAGKGPPRDAPYVAKPGYFDKQADAAEQERKFDREQAKLEHKRELDDKKVQEENASQKRRDVARTSVEAWADEQEKAELAKRDKLRTQIDTYRKQHEERDKLAERLRNDKRRALIAND